MSRDACLIVVGALTPAVALLVLGVVEAARCTGYTIECRCGYITGTRDSTPRGVMWARWRWHRAAHRIGLTPRRWT